MFGPWSNTSEYEYNINITQNYRLMFQSYMGNKVKAVY